MAELVGPGLVFGFPLALITGLFPESRGAVAARTLNTQKCFAENLKWPAYWVMADAAGGSGQVDYDYNIVFERTSGGIHVTVTPIP